MPRAAGGTRKGSAAGIGRSGASVMGAPSRGLRGGGAGWAWDAARSSAARSTEDLRSRFAGLSGVLS
jgi:hypothetical protein